ncbi:MAG: NAD(P)H-dependent oxidoreductase subunit E [Candidatus Latescibacterota bacterium]
MDADRCTACGDCWSHCPVRHVPQPVPAPRGGEELTAPQVERVDAILARYEGDPAPLIQVLQDLNDERRYLPRPELEYLAVRLEVPLAEVLRVASFYNAFSLEPVGRHVVEVCLGTACFVRGSGMLMERLAQHLGVPGGGGTDRDGRFTLRTVRCIGCCALAPSMRIDGITFGRVRLDRVDAVLEQFA